MLNLRLASAIVLSLLAPSAEAMVRDGYCALVVASRQSLAEVHLFELQNPQLTVTDVYEASNGWYAISIGQVPLVAADRRLEELRQSGTVPADSFCSQGTSYMREVGRDAVGDAPAVWTADTSLEAPFDARPMSVEEKRFLQSALAYLGFYAGVLEGEWGRGSQSALDRFAFEVAGTDATNFDAALLMMVMQEVYREEGWQYRYFDQYGVSLFLPIGGLQTGGDAAGLALDHLGMGISVYITRGGAADVGGYHQRFEARHDGTTEIYQVREADRWVTAAAWDGASRYLRSEKHGGVWTSVFVSAPPAPQSAVNLVVGSIVFGPSASMVLPAGGYAQQQIAAVARLDIEPPAPAPEPPVPASSFAPAPVEVPPPASTVLGSGTAFYVDAEGNALTNAHVIEGCRSVSLGGAPAEVLAVSRQNDLAVLAPSSPAGTYPYLAFASSPAALNSDVTVAGFPLQPILGGLNVTRGSVSSLSGLQGDITTMQITAPIQPGNSGGPVVNRDGQVVGVVVAKIALEAALQRFGSVPENVNFAIRSDIAKLFLTANGIGFEEANSPRDLSPEDLADELQHATVLVECFQ